TRPHRAGGGGQAGEAHPARVPSRRASLADPARALYLQGAPAGMLAVPRRALVPLSRQDPCSKGRRMNLARFPRIRLGHMPTPLERMEALSRHLGGPSIWIKRDDCT